MKSIKKIDKQKTNKKFAGRRLEKLNFLLNKPWFSFGVGMPLVNLLGLFGIVSHAITISDKFAQEKVIIKVSKIH